MSETARVRLSARRRAIVTWHGRANAAEHAISLDRIRERGRNGITHMSHLLDIEISADELPVIVGPTASGKSELALRLAELLGGEIVGADSVQIYRHFDRGSGKPGTADLARARHHLVDAVDPNHPIDAAEFARMADDAIADVRRRGKCPILCGGTFLWVLAVIYGLANAPPADAAIRRRHAQTAEEHGRAHLHTELSRIDPRTAARLSPNDFVRVSRALEVWELSGRTMADWQDEHGFRTPRYKAKLLGVHWPNEVLVARIAARTRQFLAAGWIDEVRELVARGYRDTRAMASVGYRQVLDHVEGRLPADDLASNVDRATKIFARRQRTWLREQPVVWIPGETVQAGG